MMMFSSGIDEIYSSPLLTISLRRSAIRNAADPGDVGNGSPSEAEELWSPTDCLRALRELTIGGWI